MTRRLRRAVFFYLLALGALGMLGTGSGVWSGPSWVWLAVLVLAVAYNVGHTYADRTQRLARRTERRFRTLEEEFHRERRKAIHATAALAKELADHRAIITPEGVKHLHSVVQKMAEDLKPMREDWESVRAAGGWRSLLKR